MKENENKERDEITLVIEKNKKKRKRHLMFLLLLLFGTGIMLTTSTYAWFTSNQTVAVNTITVNIAAKNGIQVSVDGTNWKSIIQTTDIKTASTTYTGAKNQLPSSLEPVSSALTVGDDGLMEMFYGEVAANATGDWYLKAQKSTETNGTEGKFIAFDLFIKSDTSTNLYMTPSSAVTADANDTGIKNASRVAFVMLGNTTLDDTVDKIQALGTTNAAGSNVYLWEPNYDVHTTNAISHARDTYGLPITAGPGAPRVNYDGILAAIDPDTVKVGEANATKHSAKFKAVTSTYTTTAANADYTQIFGLTAGVTKVRIYMWVEGQDVDCENTASGGNINYDLQFTTTLPTP